MEFTDRYQALGIAYPDAGTVCEGHCEGTGWVPVREDDEDPQFAALWRKAHSRAHTFQRRAWNAIKFHDPGALTRPCDGWHFVQCPDCEGTGKKENNDAAR